jgi:hypothetical protein
VSAGWTPLLLIRDFSFITGFSMRNQLIAANGKVKKVAIIANKSEFRVPSPAMTRTC